MVVGTWITWIEKSQVVTVSQSFVNDQTIYSMMIFNIIYNINIYIYIHIYILHVYIVQFIHIT